MEHYLTSRLAALTVCLLLPIKLVAIPQMNVPDLTRGDSLPEQAEHDWNLGATGARGWMFSDKQVTSDARQISVTKVEPGAPADGKLQVGDVILGVGGKPFSLDPRTELGMALTQAESSRQQGTLALMCWRNGGTDSVAIELPVLGEYSQTAPFDCPKSERILARGCQALASRIDSADYRPNAITRSLNALALLASGDPQYQSLVKSEAEWAANFSADSFQTWWYGYVIMFLSEYIIATGDDSVVPGLERLAREAANGQSIVGSWGHRFALRDGRLGGYGMMNSPGIPLTIGLVLAQKAGIDDPAVDRAIERSVRLLRFYVGKGAVPYGDHRPWIQTHEDNGKCGMAAVLFNLLGDEEATTFFARMSLAAHGAERDIGHTGNFFNLLWAMPAVALSGPAASGAWMEEFGSWYFDLARCQDGSFAHQGPPQQKNDSYRGWDCTGAYLLASAMPLKRIYLTGRQPSCAPRLSVEAAREIIRDGRGWNNKHRFAAYDQLSSPQLVSRLSNWSPIVRERAAIALGRRQDEVVSDLVDLLASPDRETQYGACQALKLQRQRAANAVPALIELLRDDDLWLRILAAEALAGIGEPAKKAVPHMLAMLTESDPENDPRDMEQRYLSFALFNRRDGLIGRSLDGVDRDLLVASVRAGLQNQDGRARSSYASVYQNLTFGEIEPLLPAIFQAIVEPAPSGIMFADGIRMSGLELFSKHKVSEGIELLAHYARHQKQHGSQKRIVTVMEMLKSYGAHGQRVIADLRETADFFEHREEGFPRRLSMDKARIVREAIVAIEASTENPTLIELPKLTSDSGN